MFFANQDVTIGGKEELRGAGRFKLEPRLLVLGYGVSSRSRVRCVASFL